jgi:hypothetical protein
MSAFCGGDRDPELGKYRIAVSLPDPGAVTLLSEMKINHLYLESSVRKMCSNSGRLTRRYGLWRWRMKVALGHDIGLLKRGWQKSR